MTIRNKNLTRSGADRPRGSRNKTTTSIKKAIMAALNDGDGATAFFIKLKREDSKTFAMCCMKLLPYEVKHTEKKDNEITIRLIGQDGKEVPAGSRR